MQSLSSLGQQSIEDGQHKYFVADPENQAQNTNYGYDHGLRLILDQQKHAYHNTKLDNDVRPNRGDIESNNEATPLIKSRSMRRRYVCSHAVCMIIYYTLYRIWFLAYLQ